MPDPRISRRGDRLPSNPWVTHLGLSKPNGAKGATNQLTPRLVDFLQKASFDVDGTQSLGFLENDFCPLVLRCRLDPAD